MEKKKAHTHTHTNYTPFVHRRVVTPLGTGVRARDRPALRSDSGYDAYYNWAEGEPNNFDGHDESDAWVGRWFRLEGAEPGQNWSRCSSNALLPLKGIVGLGPSPAGC